jgi:hypothetical protein
LWLAAVFTGGRALAASAPIAPASTGGSYTVSYARCSGCVADWLEERAENGSWTYVGQGAVTFTSKPSGTYYYRAAHIYLVDPSYYSYWTDYSAETRVTVGGQTPAVDSLDIQLSYRYQTRYGDGNGDGRLDLLVDRVAGGTPGNGALESVLLVQGGAGQFSSLVPSGAQLAAARAWPAAAVQVVLRDLNADGFADVVLKGIAGLIGGALNQVVYAPGRVLTQLPLGVRAVDPALKRFAANARDYLADSSYFSQNAPVVVRYTVVYYTYCTPSYYGYDYYYYGINCGSYPVYVPITTRDYSSFSSGAIEAWTQESAIESNRVTREQGVQAIKRSFESVLGVPIGGRDLRGIAGEQGSFDEPTARRGFELFLAVLGIFEANAQELEPAREAVRRPDIVYVTGRRILGFLPIHTALEYGGSTISAYDNNSSFLDDGVLVSQVNWPSDRPSLMMTLGTVSSTLGSTLYWAQLRASDGNYDDNLPYDAVPSAGAGGYNSNGYSHGLVRATAGVASIDMTRFVGGEKPVPANVFY